MIVIRPLRGRIDIDFRSNLNTFRRMRDNALLGSAAARLDVGPSACSDITGLRGVKVGASPRSRIIRAGPPTGGSIHFVLTTVAAIAGETQSSA